MNIPDDVIEKASEARPLRAFHSILACRYAEEILTAAGYPALQARIAELEAERKQAAQAGDPIRVAQQIVSGGLTERDQARELVKVVKSTSFVADITAGRARIPWSSWERILKLAQAATGAPVVPPVSNEKITIPRDLLECLVDSEPCHFDHHGGCQEHGHLSLQPGEKCPHQEAKELLAQAAIGAEPAKPDQPRPVPEATEGMLHEACLASTIGARGLTLHQKMALAINAALRKGREEGVI